VKVEETDLHEVSERNHKVYCENANIYVLSVIVLPLDIIEWYRALSLHYACIQSLGIILTPRLPLCQISFLWWPPLLSKPMEKNRVLNQSLSHSVTQLIWRPRNWNAQNSRIFQSC